MLLDKGLCRTFALVTLLGLLTPPLRSQEGSQPLPPGAVARLGQASFWHGASIRALAFTPDEALIASLGNDHAIRLWDTATGRLRLRLDCPTPKSDNPKERVLLTAQGPTMFFSGNGKTLAVVDLAGRVCRLWDLADGRLLPAIPLKYSVEEVEPPAGIAAAPVLAAKRGDTGIFALSHDGRLFAQAKDHVIHVSTPGTKDPVYKLTAGTTGIGALAFSPDGTSLAAGDDDSIRIWNLTHGKVTATLTGHRAALLELAFAPSGKRLLSASADGSLRLWDLATGKSLVQVPWKPPHLQEATSEVVVSTLRTVTPHVHNLWFEPGEQRLGVFYSLAFGTTGMCEDVAVRFDTATGKVLSRQTVHDQRSATSTVVASTVVASTAATVRTALVRTAAVAMAPGRNLIARAAASSHVQLLKMDTGLPTTSGLHSGCVDVEMSGDHVAIVQQGDAAIYLWNWKAATGSKDAQNDPKLRTLSGHTGKPFLVGFGPRGDTLITASRDLADRALSLWDVPRAAEVRQIASWHPGVAPATVSLVTARTSGTAAVPAPALSPDGKRIAYRGLDGKLHVVEVATGADVAKFDFTWKGDGGAGFTADGQQIVVSDSQDHRRIAFAIGAVRPAPKGEHSCHLHLFDAATGKDLGQVNAASYEFHIMRLVVAGRHALVGCKDGFIRLIDLDSGRVLRDLWQPRVDPNRPAALVATTANRAPFFVPSSDRRMIAVRSPDDGRIHVIEVATGKERLAVAEQGGFVTCMGFAGDDHHLVTGSQDSAVLVWALGASGMSKLADAERAALGDDLSHDDAGRAFQALRKLLGDPAAAVQVSSTRLQPAPTPNDELVTKKIRDLDSASFTTRQKAQDDLIHMGDVIRSYLEKAGADKAASSEVKQRVGAILKRLDAAAPSGDQLRARRIVELLERLGSKEAKVELERLAAGAPTAALTLDARTSLQRLAIPGTPQE